MFENNPLRGPHILMLMLEWCRRLALLNLERGAILTVPNLVNYGESSMGSKPQCLVNSSYQLKMSQ